MILEPIYVTQNALYLNDIALLYMPSCKKNTYTIIHLYKLHSIQNQTNLRKRKKAVLPRP